MISTTAMTLDELVSARQRYGAQWDEAYAVSDFDAMEEIMVSIRALSHQIARRVAP